MLLARISSYASRSTIIFSTATPAKAPGPAFASTASAISTKARRTPSALSMPRRTPATSECVTISESTLTATGKPSDAAAVTAASGDAAMIVGTVRIP
jgi:hypothetical protein